MRLTRKLYLTVREVIPIEHTLIKKIMQKTNIYNLLDILEGKLPNRVKRDYVRYIDLDESTTDKIWEAYQGDMWVKTEVYGEKDSVLR